MTVQVNEKSKVITELLNGTNTTLKNILPLHYDLTGPKLMGRSLYLQFGILIGIAGDIKARLVLMGNPSTFSGIAKAMYGMELEGDMLASFSGELGNMLTGGVSTYIEKSGIKTDITAPTIMQGDTTLTGYNQAVTLSITFDYLETLDIMLLLDT